MKTVWLMLILWPGGLQSEIPVDSYIKCMEYAVIIEQKAKRVTCKSLTVETKLISVDDSKPSYIEKRFSFPIQQYEITPKRR